jgi:hypothetical protein
MNGTAGLPDGMSWTLIAITLCSLVGYIIIDFKEDKKKQC